MFSQQKYLAITITDNIDWGQHISKISSQATKTHGFLRRNLAFAPYSTKKVAYKTLVQSTLGYASPILSPYSKLQINQGDSSGDECPLELQVMAKHKQCWLNELEVRRGRSSLFLFHKRTSSDKAYIFPS